MTRRTPQDLQFTAEAWPAHAPPKGFADAVLARHPVLSPSVSPRSRSHASSMKPRGSVFQLAGARRWSWALAALALGMGASAAAYQLGAWKPPSVQPDTPVAAQPSYTPVPSVPALNSAASEPERAAPASRKSVVLAPAAASPTVSATPFPSEELPVVPHYPPCHCGPGGVVCSCFE